MKTIKYTLAALALTLSGSAFAQNLSSAYFLDGYAQGHELNPAKEYDRKGYFGFPLSNLNLSVKGNMDIQDFLYKNPNGKGLVTYMHPDISTDEALKAFSKNNKILMDMRFELLSIGFHAFKGYNTLTAGIRTNMGVNLPYELFELTKGGLRNQDYNLSNLGVNAMVWGEVGLGHSHQVSKAIRIGVKAKVLIGGAYIDTKMDNLDLNLTGTDQWTASANATLEASLKGLNWGESKTKAYSDRYIETHPGATTYQELNIDPDFDTKNAGISGLGAAFDLGLEWDFEKQWGVKGLKLSAAILDLGFIKWKETLVAENSGEPFEFNGFNNIKIKDGDGVKFDDQLDELGDKLEDLYRLEDKGTVAGKKTRLGATLNVAVEYALPCYRHLKFGLLSTTRMQGKYSWNEGRLAITLSPAKMFEISGNVGVGTFGTNVGWIVNFHPRGLNLFVGSDHSLVKLSKQYIPMGSNYNFCMGINYPIGKSRIPKK